jgi:hypothetical protein
MINLAFIFSRFRYAHVRFCRSHVSNLEVIDCLRTKKLLLVKVVLILYTYLFSMYKKGVLLNCAVANMSSSNDF